MFGKGIITCVLAILLPHILLPDRGGLMPELLADSQLACRTVPRQRQILNQLKCRSYF